MQEARSSAVQGLQLAHSQSAKWSTFSIEGTSASLHPYSIILLLEKGWFLLHSYASARSVPMYFSHRQVVLIGKPRCIHLEN